MTRQLARITQILALDPILGADAIECATIEGWKVVVKKGLYNVGDRAVFFEIDTLLPRRPWSLFLFKDDRETYRLLTVRLRGQVSQGLLVPVAEITELETWDAATDMETHLGVTKHEPIIPAHLAGQVKGAFPSFLHKTDEPRLQSAPEVLTEIANIPIYASVKLDGTSATYYKHEGVFGACSRNLDLREEGGDTYWAVAKQIDLPARLPDGFAIQGELVGPGIQGNKLGLKAIELQVFNVFNIVEARFLSLWECEQFRSLTGLEWVPLVTLPEKESRPKTVADWLTFVDTVKYENGAQAEGIVVRSMRETYSPTLNSRLSFKVISNAYLLKNSDA